MLHGDAVRRSDSTRTWLRRVAVTVFLVGILILALVSVLNRQSSFAVVHGGVLPVLAAANTKAFLTLTKPESSTESFAELRSEGRIFEIVEGTRCRIVKRHGDLTCQQKPNYACEVRLLDGRRKGQLVWLCSDSVSPSMAWP
jgi:hypothetical protein